jgi:hypothetical protein
VAALVTSSLTWAFLLGPVWRALSPTSIVVTALSIPIPTTRHWSAHPSQPGSQPSQQGLKPSETPCPIAGHLEALDTATGVISALTCGRASRCTPCAIRKALRIQYLIHQALPTHFLTIKGLSGEPSQDLANLQCFFRSVRKRGETFESCWVIEPNRFDSGSHSHAYIRSSDFDVDHWRSAAESMGLTFHSQAHRSTIKGSGYALKLILQTDIPGDQGLDVLGPAEHAVAAHLLRNAGRLVHSSRGFFLDEHGSPSTLTSLVRRVVSAVRRGVRRAVRPLVIVYAARRRGEVIRQLIEQRQRTRSSRPPP